MAEVGEKVRIVEGWARGQVAEVVSAEPRYLELKMADGSISVFPPWRVEALGECRDPVAQSVERRIRRVKQIGGAL